MLQVTAVDPLVEGDNLTLKCVADGNPAPTSFNFHLKVLASQKCQETVRICVRVFAYTRQPKLIFFFTMSPQGDVVKVENANTYTITNVTRDTSGEYKCSLVDNPTMEASVEVVVKCKSAEMIVDTDVICVFSALPCSKCCVICIV